MFDLDGTLVDSVPLFVDILNDMLADRGAGRKVSPKQTRPHVTAGGPAMVAALLGAECGDVGQAIADFRTRYRARPTPADCLFPGVREGLTDLYARGVGLAVFSNKPQSLCEKVLTELQVDHLFGAVVGTGPGIPLKPDPTGLDEALARIGAARARCCYVGDSDADYALALGAGVPLVMVTYGYGDGPAAWSEASLAHDFAGVPDLVERLLPALARATA